MQEEETAEMRKKTQLVVARTNQLEKRLASSSFHNFTFSLAAREMAAQPDDKAQRLTIRGMQREGVPFLLHASREFA